MIIRRLDEARKAYEKRDVDASKKAHRRRTVEENVVHRKTAGKYIGDLVYGALDGVVTTFAIVAGVAGASLSSSIALILGFANLLADGFSMAVGNYLSTKSELEYGERERYREEWEIENVPEAEVEEIRQLYRKKGFEEEDLDKVVDVITSDRKVWLDTMMLEELNIVIEQKSPSKSGLATFLAFIAAGFIPLSVYVVSYLLPLQSIDIFFTTSLLTGITLFAVGSARTYATGKRWWVAGLEMAFIGGLAAAVAYTVGYLLSGLAA